MDARCYHCNLNSDPFILLAWRIGYKGWTSKGEQWGIFFNMKLFQFGCRWPMRYHLLGIGTFICHWHKIQLNFSPFRIMSCGSGRIFRVEFDFEHMGNKCFQADLNLDRKWLLDIRFGFIVLLDLFIIWSANLIIFMFYSLSCIPKTLYFFLRLFCLMKLCSILYHKEKQ